jgi:hypothetical protein
MELFISYLFGHLASMLQGESKLKDWQKYAIALGSSVLAGGLTVIIEIFRTDSYSPEQILTYIGMAFIASQTRFNLLKKYL